jgi:hypothetical protein
LDEPKFIMKDIAREGGGYRLHAIRLQSPVYTPSVGHRFTHLPRRLIMWGKDEQLHKTSRSTGGKMVLGKTID